MGDKTYHNIASEESYHDGQIILKEGMSGDWVYVVLSGSVEVSKRIDGKKFILGTLGTGEVFGELALIGAVNRTATIRAVGKTTVGIIDRRVLDDEFNRLSSDFKAIIITIVRRFMKMMDRSRDFASRKEEG